MPSFAEISKTATEAVGLEFGIAVNGCGHTPGLGPEDIARHGDGIAADIEHAAAANVGHVADVLGIAVEIGEEHLDGAHLADLALLDALLHFNPLRGMAHHEGLGDVDVLGCFFEKGCFLGGNGDGLFAQHMLARARRRKGERHMQMIGQWIVNGFDFRVGQHFFIGAVGFGNTQIHRGFSRGFEAARGNRHHL